MRPVETHRSFLNAWECDENDHLNVQFYFARFEQAARFFALHRGAGAPPELAARLVRFHAEVTRGALLIVTSAGLEGAPRPGAIGHRLIEVTGDRLVATALDLPRDEPAVSEVHGAAAGTRRAYDGAVEGPRSVALVPSDRPGRDALLANGGFVSARGVIGTADVDASGRSVDRAHVAAFSDGASHVWETVGLTRDLLETNGWGRVAVEMRLAVFARFCAGDLFEQVSRLAEVRDKTLTMQHFQYRAATGELMAAGEATGLAMDLSARKAVAMPRGLIRG